MDPVIWLYLGFGLFVIAVMVLDLGLAHRGPEIITTKRALTWTVLCVLMALAFVPAVYVIYDSHWLGMGLDSAGEATNTGFDAAAQFLQGWILEYSLSVDNLFVFALIFQFFAVPKQFQHRVLTWGIIATMVMRGAMILAGGVLILRFHWLLYVAGAFLVYTAVKMLAASGSEFDPGRSRAVRLVRRVLPVTEEYHGNRFFHRAPGRRPTATPLFLVLIVLNVVDLVFAVDSIPAIYGITRDPFLVFTSNVFAILGLRSLYFVMAQLMDKFKYLKVSLAAILGFVGVKMLTEELVEVPVWASLLVILAALGIGIVASVRKGKVEEGPPAGAPPTPLGEADAV